MNAPQIIVICLMAMGVSRGIFKHGESDGKVNAWASLIGVSINVALLWWGGFWGHR